MKKESFLFACIASIASFSLYAAEPQAQRQLVIISDQPINVREALLQRERIILEAERRPLVFQNDMIMTDATRHVRGRHRGARLGIDAVNDNLQPVQPVRPNDEVKAQLERNQARITEIDERLAEITQQLEAEGDAQDGGPIDAEAE